jgi:hypothetical protein
VTQWIQDVSGQTLRNFPGNLHRVGIRAQQRAVHIASWRRLKFHAEALDDEELTSSLRSKSVTPGN